MTARQMQKVKATDVVASRDVQTIKATMAATFDMRVYDSFASSLMAFVDATNARIAELERRVEELTHVPRK